MNQFGMWDLPGLPKTAGIICYGGKNQNCGLNEVVFV